MIEKFKEFEVLEKEDVKEKLVEKIEDFKRKLKRTLRIENPYFDNEKELEKQKEKFERGDFYFEVFLEDIEKYKKVGLDDEKYWNKEVVKYEKMVSNAKNPTLDKKLRKNIKLSRQLILTKWEEKLKFLYEEWRKDRLKKLEEEFIEKTKKWLRKREEFYQAIKNLSFGNDLFDFSESELSQYDIKEIQKWAEFIEKSEELKKLAHIIGRLKSSHKNYKQELVKVTKEYVNVKKRSEFKTEIDGIKLDNDLNLVLPHELALLEEMEILFFKKYIERSLICFESIAQKEIEEEFISKIEEEELRKVAKEDEKGPVILAIDTSASMMGEPEAIAKAITLYIASLAKKEKRDCFLINFSTSIETFEFTSKKGIKDLISFLKKSFHGGTDATPAIEYATKLMKEKYKNADLLLISDFVMHLDKSIEEKVKQAKKNKNKFYALIIGSYNKNSKIESFDKTWVFNSIHGDIEVLEDLENMF